MPLPLIKSVAHWQMKLKHILYSLEAGPNMLPLKVWLKSEDQFIHHFTLIPPCSGIENSHTVEQKVNIMIALNQLKNPTNMYISMCWLQLDFTIHTAKLFGAWKPTLLDHLHVDTLFDQGSDTNSLTNHLHQYFHSPKIVFSFKCLSWSSDLFKWRISRWTGRFKTKIIPYLLTIP